MGKYLKGQVVPQRPDYLLAVVHAIRAACMTDSDSRGLASDALLDARVWRERHQAVMQARKEENLRAQLGQQAAFDLAMAESKARRDALADQPRPVSEWTAAQLQVHPAISGAVPPPVGGFVLPAYVTRPHDQQLAACLAQCAAGQHGSVVVVRAGSCSGKTRSAFEALSAVPALADWALVFPRTAGGALGLLAAQAFTPRTVMWLDDAQHYLESAEGEALAGSLLSRLAQPGPVIVLVTIWSSSYTALTRSDDGAFPSGGTHSHIRTLLSGAVTVDVPATFSERELSVLQRSSDPSLRAAGKLTREGKVTQALAAGLELVDRYEAASDPPACYTRAMISAAMDATRLGWDSPLPHGFLRDAAPGYLTDTQRAAAPEDWFDRALIDARTKVQRVAAPLEAVPLPEGMGAQADVSRLADYLDAHGRTTRAHLSPPPVFWSAAVTHATETSHLRGLMLSAADRRRFKAAAQLARKISEAENTDPTPVLDWLREQTEVQEEAENLPSQGPETDPARYSALARMKASEQKHGEAEHFARLAFEAGDRRVYRILIRINEESGNPAEAERMCRLAAKSGDTRVYAQLAYKVKDDEEAERLAQFAASVGQSFVYRHLAGKRYVEGKEKAAESLLHKAADAGDRYSYGFLALHHERSGDHEGADHFVRLAGEAGDTSAHRDLAHMRERTGSAGAAQLPSNMTSERPSINGPLAVESEMVGNREEAVRLAHLAAREIRGIYGVLALIREDDGDQEGAEQLARLAVAAGDLAVYPNLIRIRKEGGDHQGAQRLARTEFD
ncbi:hypothetical protein [Streptomyces chartreusis]|uniref:hypothetical protein n=1 Tax=Streptomyces chartreusis TaxID=1969 RepID=UPI00364C60B2